MQRLIREIIMIALVFVCLLFAQGVVGTYLLPQVMPMRAKSVHARVISIGNITDQASGTLDIAAALIDMPMVTLTAPDEGSTIRFDSGLMGSAEFLIGHRGTMMPIDLGSLSHGYLPFIRLRDPSTNLSVWAVRVDESGLPIIEKTTP